MISRWSRSDGGAQTADGTPKGEIRLSLFRHQTSKHPVRRMTKY